MVKNLPANVGDARDVGSIPLLGRSLGEGNGNPPQYSYLENPMDRGIWRATVLKLQKSRSCPITHAQWDSVHFHCHETATTINL